MRNKRTLIVGMALLCAVLVTGAAHAGTRVFKLAPMDQTIKVDGLVSMVRRGKTEIMDLRVFTGDLKDGTILVVSAVRADHKERIPVAKVEVVLGSGLVRLNSRKDVSAVFPFRGLQELYVSLPGYGDLAHGVVPVAKVGGGAS